LLSLYGLATKLAVSLDLTQWQSFFYLLLRYLKVVAVAEVPKDIGENIVAWKSNNHNPNITSFPIIE
jgi:hypothetical protein